MQDAAVIKRIRRKYAPLRGALDERSRRLWAGTEAMELGWGGITILGKATGMSATTIRAGIAEVRLRSKSRKRAISVTPRIRRAGGGRKPITDHDPELLSALEALVEPTARGEPDSALRWTIRSTRVLAETLTRQGHAVSHATVGTLLDQAGFSLQANRKTREGKSHPDRNAQFEYIHKLVKRFQRRAQAVVSVDTKKKELVGDFKNAGRQYRPQGDPEKVRVHDFIIPELGRANPYGIYDIGRNLGWVNVGTDHDTSAFAVESIRRWWQAMGRSLYPKAERLLITADGGGSNGTRVRLWKVELQKLAEELGFPIGVCHLPPATSKWNKIEHRLFCFITMNWRGRPLVSHEVIVQLIKSTTTAQGLKVDCQLDTNLYPAGQKVSDEEMAQVNLKRDEFHGEWNYTISPQPQ